ncbi:MAG: rhomboid family intramembrane serine protease, partial [Vicinamibacterales bacterium]
NAAGLVQVGRLVERLIGPGPFAVSYLAAGLLAGVASLVNAPSSSVAGASGAVFGVYGVAMAAAACGRLWRSAIRIPWSGVRRLAPAGAIFVVYSLASADLGAAAEAWGLIAGFVAGLMLCSGRAHGVAAPRRLGLMAAAAAVLLVASGVRIRGTIDVRPELARVVAIERETSAAYDDAAARFQRRQIEAARLVAVIEETIRPRLRAVQDHLAGLHGVPPEHRPLVEHATAFARLRDESWRLRAEGLRRLAEAGGGAGTARSGRNRAIDPERDRTRAQLQARHAQDAALMGKAETAEREAHELLARMAIEP